MITIWAKKIREQKNHSLAFLFEGELPEKSTFEIVASNVYRLFVNGEFVGYGLQEHIISIQEKMYMSLQIKRAQRQLL